jgi:hypothetical protein
MLSVIILSAIMPSVFFAYCIHTESNYVVCHYAECHYAESHYVECNYAECCGTKNVTFMVASHFFSNS